MIDTAEAPAATRRSFVGPGAMEMAIYALSFLTGPIVSRSLGDDGRGSLAAVLVPVQLLGWVVLFGLPYGAAMLVREVPRRLLVDAAWRFSVLLALPLGLIGAFVGPALLRDHGPTAVTWFRVGMVAVVVGIPAATAVHLRLITSGGTWRTSLAGSLSLVLYSSTVIVLAATDHLTLDTTLAAWIGCAFAGYVIVIVCYRSWPTGFGSTDVLRRQLRIGRPQGVISLGSMTIGRLDQVFLGALVSSATLGHYAIAATAAQVSVPLANGIATVVMPDAFDRGTSEVQRSAVRLVVGMSAVIGAATAIVAPWLLPLVFGRDFEESVPLLWLMIPGQILYNAAWVISARQLGSGRGGTPARALGISAVVYVALLAPAINLIGAAGAAIATTICQATFLIGVLIGRHHRATTAHDPAAFGGAT